MWLNRFKIAIAEEDINKISDLMNELPAFEDEKQMTEALFLTKEAEKLMQRLQKENKKVLSKLTKHIKFVKSTKTPSTSKFNTSH